MYYDGQIITQTEYTKCANWINANGGKFTIEPNADGTYTVREVVVVEPTAEEKNEAIRQTRASLYAELIDKLHAQRQRKVVLGVWTEEDEEQYVTEVRRLTQKIQDENPYIDIE